MKYYGSFSYNGYIFPADVEADSLRDAVRQVETDEFILDTFSGCDKDDRSIYFSYPWLPESLPLKRLYYYQKFSWKQRKKIRSLIRDGKVRGDVSLFQTELNISDFLNYCSERAGETFQAMNIEELVKEAKERIATPIKPDFIFPEYQIFEDDDPVAKAMVRKKKEERRKTAERRLSEIKQHHRKEQKRIRYLFDIKKEEINDSMEFASGNYDIIDASIYKCSQWIEMFYNDFQQATSTLKLTYLTLLQAMLKNYTGIKIDGNTTSGGFHNRYQNWTTEYYYLKDNGKFELDKELPMPPRYMHSYCLSSVFMFMQIPYNQYEGVWKRTIRFAGQEITFTLELAIEEYGESVIVRWTDVEFDRLKI